MVHSSTFDIKTQIRFKDRLVNNVNASVSTGLEFTGGEGTSYPRQFDSTPGQSYWSCFGLNDIVHLVVM